MLCEAKPLILFSILFYLFTGNDILEKREKREVKREKYKKKRQSSFENCRFFRGWGRWIRTTGMADSESAALPLGDTPLFICDITYYITVMKKVKHYFYCGAIKK